MTIVITMIMTLIIVIVRLTILSIIIAIRTSIPLMNIITTIIKIRRDITRKPKSICVLKLKILDALIIKKSIKENHELFFKVVINKNYLKLY